MDRNEQAKAIAAVRKRQAKLIRLMAHYAGQLVEIDNEICALMCEAAHYAGLDDDVTATVIEPKDDKDGKGG